jgi:hypothetical protein
MNGINFVKVVYCHGSLSGKLLMIVRNVVVTAESDIKAVMEEMVASGHQEMRQMIESWQLWNNNNMVM